MASTIYNYNLTGGRVFPVAFEYLARRFVQITLVGDTRRQLQLNVDYRFISKTEIETTVPWTAGGYQTLEVRRVTSATDRLVNFTDGSILRSQDLNISQIQAIHIAEEGRDIADSAILNNGYGWNAEGLPIKNLGETVEPTDAATKAYVDDSIQYTVRAPEKLGELPAALARAGLLLGFNASGQPIMVAPVSGSAADLATILANNLDPLKGAATVGFARTKAATAVGTVGGYLSAQWYNIIEAAFKVTDRPNPTDMSTWDWTPAFQYAVDTFPGKVIYASSALVPSYRLGLPGVRLPSNRAAMTIVKGDPESTTFVLDPTVSTAFGFAATPSSGAMMKNFDLSGFLVDASKTAGTDGAVIFGNRNSGREAILLSYDNIRIKDVRCYGMSSDTSAGKFRIGIQISSIFNSISDPKCTMTRIYVDNIRVEGGITGMYMGAGVPISNNAPLWMDDIYVDKFFHDTLLEDAGFPAAGIQIGQDGCGGKIRVSNAYSANGGDVGIEINGFYDQRLTNCVLYRPGTGFWAYNYHELENPARQHVVWDNCHVIRPKNNPAWRIGQTRAGHFVLNNCSVEIDEKCDPRALDFAAGSLVGIESLTLINFKYYARTGVKADYISLASALSLHLNTPSWKLKIDGMHIIYEGQVPRLTHECCGIILNSLNASSKITVDIKGLTVSDRRAGTLAASDAVRVYGSVKVVGSISNMTVDSTVSTTIAKHGVFLAAGSVPAPDLIIRDSDLLGCTSLYELRTTKASQRNTVQWDNVTFAMPFDDLTKPFNPPVSDGSYDWRNNRGMPVRVAFMGGTNVAILTSQDGINWWNTGQVAGTVMLSPNESIRITSTAAPSMRVVVWTKIPNY